mmetsp:Transcript_5466/g.11282  ORF Transcript_5466/g.11282 Transcript_5466/m.11282 type:complete len:186 (+) Transcript_5466:3926-4483(+)
MADMDVILPNYKNFPSDTIFDTSDIFEGITSSPTLKPSVLPSSKPSKSPIKQPSKPSTYNFEGKAQFLLTFVSSKMSKRNLGKAVTAIRGELLKILKTSQFKKITKADFLNISLELSKSGFNRRKKKITLKCNIVLTYSKKFNSKLFKAKVFRTMLKKGSISIVKKADPKKLKRLKKIDSIIAVK